MGGTTAWTITMHTTDSTAITWKMMISYLLSVKKALTALTAEALLRVMLNLSHVTTLANGRTMDIAMICERVDFAQLGQIVMTVGPWRIQISQLLMMMNGGTMMITTGTWTILSNMQDTPRAHPRK